MTCPGPCRIGEAWGRRARGSETSSQLCASLVFPSLAYLLVSIWTMTKEKEKQKLPKAKINARLWRGGGGGGCSHARGSHFGPLRFPGRSGQSDGKGKEYSLILRFTENFSLCLSVRRGALVSFKNTRGLVEAHSVRWLSAVTSLHWWSILLTCYGALLRQRLGEKQSSG